MSFSGNSRSFEKGKSGNSKGRPRKYRVLAGQIEQEGAEKNLGAGEHTNSEQLAKHVWQALIMGEVDLIGGRTYKLTTKEWIDFVKWAHQHVDGTINIGITAGIEAETEADPEAGLQIVQGQYRPHEIAQKRDLILSQRRQYDAGKMLERDFRWLCGDLKRRGVYVDDVALPEPEQRVIEAGERFEREQDEDETEETAAEMEREEQGEVSAEDALAAEIAAMEPHEYRTHMYLMRKMSGEDY